MPQHGQVVLAVIDLAGGGVPIPKAVAAGIHGQQQTVGTAHRSGLARQKRRQTARYHQGPPIPVTVQDRGRQQQGKFFGTGRHQQQALPARTQGDVQPAAQACQRPRRPVQAAQTAQGGPVQRPGPGPQPQQTGAAGIQQQGPFLTDIGPVATVFPCRQGSLMTHIERAEDRLRPAVGIALDDAQVFANMPPVVGIGTAQAAGPLPCQGHPALALQKATLRFRQPVQKIRHGLRRRLRRQAQQKQGRRAKDEAVRRQMPGKTGGGVSRKGHGPSLVFECEEYRHPTQK